jgi:hypothetical protein
VGAALAGPSAILLKLPVSEHKASSPRVGCYESRLSGTVNSIGHAARFEGFPVPIDQDATEHPLPKLSVTDSVCPSQCCEVHAVGQRMCHVSCHPLTFRLTDPSPRLPGTEVDGQGSAHRPAPEGSHAPSSETVAVRVRVGGSADTGVP